MESTARNDSGEKWSASGQGAKIPVSSSYPAVQSDRCQVDGCSRPRTGKANRKRSPSLIGTPPENRTFVRCDYHADGSRLQSAPMVQPASFQRERFQRDGHQSHPSRPAYSPQSFPGRSADGENCVVVSCTVRDTGSRSVTMPTIIRKQMYLLAATYPQAGDGRRDVQLSRRDVRQ
jgi:hypothetical protein